MKMFPTAVAERWIMTKVEACQPQEIAQLTAMIMQIKRTGKLIINFNQGVMGDVSFRERESILQKVSLDKSPTNGRTVRSG